MTTIPHYVTGVDTIMQDGASFFIKMSVQSVINTIGAGSGILISFISLLLIK